MIELNENDLFYGYLPGDGSGPDRMEQDGFYPENLSWRHDNLHNNGLTPSSDLYDGSGPELCPQIDKKFTTVLEAREI